jgi:hypothetical protein
MPKMSDRPGASTRLNNQGLVLLIHLPPNAQLPRMRAILEEFCSLLDRALEPGRRFKPDPDDPKNDLRLAVVMHALSALDAARAVHNLSGTEYAGTLTLHFRTVFEALVKIRWMRKRPKRARRFFMSAPFERYILATTRVKKSTQWAEIVKECDELIARYPALLRLRKVKTGKNNPPNMKRIARALRMPNLEVMSEKVGMDEDDLFLDHDFPSLAPHTSVLAVDQYGKRRTADGTITLSTEMEPNLLIAYVSRSAVRVGGLVEEVLRFYPDGKIEFDAEDPSQRLTSVVDMLKRSMVR